MNTIAQRRFLVSIATLITSSVIAVCYKDAYFNDCLDKDPVTGCNLFQVGSKIGP